MYRKISLPALLPRNRSITNLLSDINITEKYNKNPINWEIYEIQALI